jgi:preprotein translocase subunit SecE
MDNTKKYVSIIFIFCSIFVWYVFNTFFRSIFTYFQIYEIYAWLPIASKSFAFILGGISLLIFHRYKIVYDYLFEVINEIKKVTWPNKKETWSATFVVIVAVLIAGLVLGVFDWISASLLELILT